MERTTKNIKDVLNELRVQNEEYPEALLNEMDSARFNKTQFTISKQLDDLYVKIRLLETLDNYTTEYVKQEIEKKEQLFKERLKIIEDVSDIYRDNRSISTIVPLYPCNEIVRDRNGAELTLMSIDNHQLETAGNVLSMGSIKKVIRSSDEACYNHTYRTLPTEHNASTLYYTDNTPKYGVEEKLHIYLSYPIEANWIQVKPINSSIKSIGIISDSNEEILIDHKDPYIDSKVIQGIVVTLSSKDYSFNKMDYPIYLDNAKTVNLFPSANVIKGDTTKDKEKLSYMYAVADTAKEVHKEYGKWKRLKERQEEAVKEEART